MRWGSVLHLHVLNRLKPPSKPGKNWRHPPLLRATLHCCFSLCQLSNLYPLTSELKPGGLRAYISFNNSSPKIPYSPLPLSKKNTRCLTQNYLLISASLILCKNISHLDVSSPRLSCYFSGNYQEEREALPVATGLSTTPKKMLKMNICWHGNRIWVKTSLFISGIWQQLGISTRLGMCHIRRWVLSYCIIGITHRSHYPVYPHFHQVRVGEAVDLRVHNSMSGGRVPFSARFGDVFRLVSEVSQTCLPMDPALALLNIGLNLWPSLIHYSCFHCGQSRHRITMEAATSSLTC